MKWIGTFFLARKRHCPINYSMFVKNLMLAIIPPVRC
jgi:hypothetical protein